MRNHFIMSYFGNKRSECDKIYEQIKDLIENKNITTIVEPYCGSSAFSYYLSTLYPNKFKYILNDNDKNLIDLYKIMKDKKKRKKFEVKINDLAKTITSKDIYNDIRNKNTLESYYLTRKIYSIRPGLFNLNYKYKEILFNEYPIIEFLENEDVEIFNDDALQIINKYKDNQNALIFLDPPYLALCNDFYSNKDVNIYEHLYFNKIHNMKSLIVLVLEKIWIIELLFNDYKIKEYNKLYQTTKKKTIHIIITNELK